MCLNNVWKTKPVNEGVGWKVVGRDKKGNFVPPFQVRHGLKFKPRTWTVDNGKVKFIVYEIADGVNEQDKVYPAGFHLYASKKVALLACASFDNVVKVQYRKAVAQGTQRDHKVIVAREIKLLSRVKE
jgi:hypothetical protein